MVDEVTWLSIASRSNPQLSNKDEINSTNNGTDPGAGPINQLRGFGHSRVHRDPNQWQEQNHRHSPRQGEDQNQNQRSQKLSRVKQLECTLLKMNSVIEVQKETIEKQRLRIVNLNQKLVESNGLNSHANLHDTNFREENKCDDDIDIEDGVDEENVSLSPVKKETRHTKQHHIAPAQRHQIGLQQTNANIVSIANTGADADTELWVTKIKNHNPTEPGQNSKPNASIQTKVPKYRTRTTTPTSSSLTVQNQLVEISSRLFFLEEKIDKLEKEFPKKVQAIISKGMIDKKHTGCNCYCSQHDCENGDQTGLILQNKISETGSRLYKPTKRNCNVNHNSSSLQIAEKKLSNIESAVDTFKEFLLRFVAFRRT